MGPGPLRSARARDRAQRAARDGSDRTIAVVEPDALLRALLVRALRMTGYLPLILSTCAELSGAGRSGTRLAIVDELAAPVGSGLGAMRLPIVLLASDDMVPANAHWRVVVKPFTLEEVLEAVEALIAEGHPPQGGRST